MGEILDVDDQVIGELLDFMRTERGFDFTDYKLSTIRRRVDRRMSALGIESIEAYREHLERDPSEFPLLLDLLLINVTDFFRDQEAWETLSVLLKPRVQDAIEEDRHVRVWCPGCASGEEPYTIAMVLAEIMGENEFRQRVRIFATDIDENALVRARSGNYNARAMESLEPALRESYFTPQGGSYVFRADLRQSMTFGFHDITADPPISRLDLLSFRNTLIYFNPALQRRILGRFRAAINPGGLLFLGRSESLVLQQDYFKPVDSRHRIFEPVPRRAVIESVPSPINALLAEADGPIGSFMEGVNQVGPNALFVLDLEGHLVGANASACVQYSITEDDLGRQIDDKLAAYFPFSFASIIEAAHATRTPQMYARVERSLAGDQVQYLDVVVSPINDDSRAPVGTSVVAIDTSETVRLEMERDLAIENAQALSEELRGSLQDLQTTNEELQTSNEELQSMNEELATTNDELTTELLGQKRIDSRLSDTSAEQHDGVDGLLDRMTTGVILTDGAEVVQFANGTARRLFGVSDVELIGMPWATLAGRISGSETQHFGSINQLETLGPQRVSVKSSPNRSTDCELVVAVSGGGANGRMLLFLESFPDN